MTEAELLQLEQLLERLNVSIDRSGAPLSIRRSARGPKLAIDYLRSKRK